MARTIINTTVYAKTQAPYIRRLMANSNGKVLVEFDNKTQVAHNGGLLLGDKNATGTGQFAVKFGGVIWQALSTVLHQTLTSTTKTISSMCSVAAVTTGLSLSLPSQTSHCHKSASMKPATPKGVVCYG